MTDTITPEMELANAEATYRALAVRVAEGDNKVTPAKLAEASQTVEYLRTRVEYAEAAAAKQREESAAKLAATIRKNLGKVSTAKADAAISNAEQALREYVEAVHKYHLEVIDATSGVYSLTDRFQSNSRGTLTDLSDGTSHRTDLNPAQEIQDMVLRAWEHYAECGARPGRGPFDRY